MRVVVLPSLKRRGTRMAALAAIAASIGIGVGGCVFLPLEQTYYASRRGIHPAMERCLPQRPADAEDGAGAFSPVRLLACVVDAMANRPASELLQELPQRREVCHQPPGSQAVSCTSYARLRLEGFAGGNWRDRVIIISTGFAAERLVSAGLRTYTRSADGELLSFASTSWPEGASIHWPAASAGGSGAARVSP